MDLQQYWLALKARRKAFLVVFAFTVVAAVVVSLVVPKRYDAVATVLIDSPDSQTLGPEARISPRERAGYMFTQVELIQSGKVAQRVARDLKLAQQPGVREEWEKDTGGLGTIDEWLAKNLLEKLKVDNGAANIITIKFSSSDRKYSAAVANAFAKAYLQTALEMRTEPSREAAAWFEGQLKSLRNDVVQAQQRLTAYQKKTGVVGGERADIEYSRLTELSTALSGARNAALDAEARYKQAKDAAASAGAAAELPEVLANPYIITVKTALQAAEGRLEEQSRELGKNHPAYQRTQLEVQTLRERLNGETKKLIASLGNAAQQAKKREQELTAALSAQQDRIVKARDASVEMAVLTRDLDSAQRAYETATTRYIATKVESRARQTNLAMLTPAVAPVEPAAPRIGLISGLSVLIGLLLAAGLVYLLEMTDRRVRSRGDLEQKLAVPSLGNLSKWLPSGGRLLPSPSYAGQHGTARALPQPW
jgi:chain length determinant protein EpsF